MAFCNEMSLQNVKNFGRTQTFDRKFNCTKQQTLFLEVISTYFYTILSLLLLICI